MDFVIDCPGNGCSYRVGTVPAGRRGDGLPVSDGDRERAADFDFVLLGEVEMDDIVKIMMGKLAVIGVAIIVMGWLAAEGEETRRAEIAAASVQQCGQAGSSHD